MDIKQNPQSDSETNLEKFAINLNEQAKKNKLDPVIGREKEINRLIRILSRKNKNNPVLIGEPGVGKTAVVEGLAQRIVKNDVPENLSDKIIYQLDLGLLVAGAKFHGEFEARLKGILQQIKKSQNTIILFIDELHLIVGTGRTQGSMDTSNLLKPMLARGELRCVGSTTLDEYRQYIEKDKALERRFQKILVQEPSEEETITILRGLRERFEVFHGVFIHDSALVAAAKLAQRYISDRFLPDKAIDLIDEACAFIKTQINSVPLELDDANRKIMQLQIEQAALAREKDTTSKEKLKKIKEELAQAQAEQTKIKAKWESESTKVNLIKKLKTEIEHLKQELDNVPISGDFLRAGKIKYSILPAKIAELDLAQKAIKNNQLIKEDITEHEVADVVSQWTGIPVARLEEDEQQKLLNLPTLLQQRVKGQQAAILAVTDAILRSRSGIKDQHKPIGSFLFLGPTGVGKTEVARTLAQALFNSERNMIRLDMTEYREQYAISKLVGSAPGYIGYEKGGTLTEAVRRAPYSIVLFDEIEKAHHNVINLLLQVMDHGTLTDSLGKKVSFKNTIIIMTSNIAADAILKETGAVNKIEYEWLTKHLQKFFKAEFINRIDNIITFNSLKKPVIYEIAQLELDKLKTRVSRIKNLDIAFDQSVVEQVVNSSYTPEFGARPIKNYIEQNITTVIAEKIIRKILLTNKKYTMWCEKEQFYLDLTANLN